MTGRYSSFISVHNSRYNDSVVHYLFDLSHDFIIKL